MSTEFQPVREVPIGIALSPELDRDHDFGGEVDESGFVARMADTPLAHDIGEVFEQAGVAAPSSVALYKRFRVWLIPHRVSIMRRSGFAEPVSVGVEVEYQADGEPCAVVGLLPSFRYVEHGSLAMKATLNGAGEIAVGREGDGDSNSFNVAGLSFCSSGSGSVGISLSAKVVTPLIAATGIGSRRAEWRFEKEDEPLFGRDIETWSLVVRPKRRTETQYRMRFSFTSRTFFVPTRHESDWVTLACRLT